MLPHPSCPRCEDVALEAHPDESGALLFVCPRCEALLVPGDELARVFVGARPEPADDGLPLPFGDASKSVCPACGEATLESVALADASFGVRRCARCDAHAFEAAAFVAVRRGLREREPGLPSTEGLELDEQAVRPVAREAFARWRDGAALGAPAHVTGTVQRPATKRPPPLTDDERRGLRDVDPGLAMARIAHDEPMALLLGLPVAFALATLLSFTRLGELLALPMRIQFHELGHALPAWWMGRAAVPLPCGLTLIPEETNVGVHVVLVLFATLLVIRGTRERTPFPLALAALLELGHLTFSLVLSESAGQRYVLLNGGAGELWLSGLVVASFYFRMPDVLRWDFFRFLVLPFAAASYVGAMRLWLAVLVGDERAPVGSIVGTVGDGSGDLERLVADHGMALSGIVRGYIALGIVVGLGIAAVYALHVPRALAGLRRARAR